MRLVYNSTYTNESYCLKMCDFLFFFIEIWNQVDPSNQIFCTEYGIHGSLPCVYVRRAKEETLEDAQFMLIYDMDGLIHVEKGDPADFGTIMQFRQRHDGFCWIEQL